MKVIAVTALVAVLVAQMWHQAKAVDLPKYACYEGHCTSVPDFSCENNAYRYACCVVLDQHSSQQEEPQPGCACCSKECDVDSSDNVCKMPCTSGSGGKKHPIVRLSQTPRHDVQCESY